MLPSLSAPFAGWLAGHVVCPFRLRLPRTAAALVLLVCTVLYVSPSVLYVLVCSLLSLLSISSAHCSVRCSTRTCTCSSACLLVALLLVLSSSLVVFGALVHCCSPWLPVGLNHPDALPWSASDAHSNWVE